MFTETQLTQRKIFWFWLPLAAMSVMMSIEQPAIAAVIARLPSPELNLAAFGVALSLAFFIQGPTVMLLTTGTALSQSRQSYQRLMRFTHIVAGGMTVVYLVVGLTPLYRLIVGTLIGAPAEIIELGRGAFLFLTPWLWVIAYRLLWQGVMIRFGRTKLVALAIASRTATTMLILAIGLIVGRHQGVYVGSFAMSVSAIVAASVASWLVRPTLREHLSDPVPDAEPLHWGGLLDFYVPLALTIMITDLARPLRRKEIAMDERNLIAKAQEVRGTRDTLQEVFERGTLRVLVEFGPPPTEGPPPEFYYDPETGEPTGVACELGKLVAKDLGVEVEWVDLPWPDQLPAFLDGKADLLPKHTNTALRGLLVDFSVHRLQRIEVVAIARKGGPIRRKEDLDSEDVAIGSWHGSSNIEVARRLFPKARIVEDSRPWNLLASGRVQAVITDCVTRVALQKFSDFDFVRNDEGEREILNLEYGYPAVFPGDTRFLNWLNNFMAYRWNDGTLKYWADTWWNSWMAK